MGKVVYREFLGSRLVFLVLCLTGIGIPIAVIYLIEGFVTVEEEVADPTGFIQAYRRRSSWGA
jgi:hypothetical protein